jgi:hypothetical protein
MLLSLQIGKGIPVLYAISWFLVLALSALPSFGDWLAPLAWTVWGVGFPILAVRAVALHTLISMTRRVAVQ